MKYYSDKKLEKMDKSILQLQFLVGFILAFVTGLTILTLMIVTYI
jgi:hypothetical protein